MDVFGLNPSLHELQVVPLEQEVQLSPHFSQVGGFCCPKPTVGLFLQNPTMQLSPVVNVPQV